jgi:D-beta-D-heptose 7-phosphate kinase / D-beta-D-heptose 1-phosphate adenosyltransferase
MGQWAKIHDGYSLVNLLKNSNVFLSIAEDAPITTTKIRLVEQRGQHILRWDREKQYTKDSCLSQLLFSLTEKSMVLISDYAKGVIKSHTVKNILEKTQWVLVDPKQSADYYDGAFLVKPNMKEYESWNGAFDVDSAVKFAQTHSWTWLIITDGAKGIHIISKEGAYSHVKEPVREVADVTGAGDTVLAVIAYGIKQGMTVPRACELACYAAARNVEKFGVVPVTKEDLNKGTVWTNGVFDILHTGHLELLKFARNQGKKLIVGINDDASVRRLKGEGRPVNDYATRKRQLEMLPWVDEVVIFTEDTPQRAIEEHKPDIIVKGGDYTVNTTVGNELAQVIIFPTVEGFSTTKIIDRLQS